MIGGIVVGVVRHPSERAVCGIGLLQPGMIPDAILCVEGEGRYKCQECDVKVCEQLENGRVVIGVGDHVWWKDGKLFWVPKDVPEHHRSAYPVTLKLLEHS